MGKLIMVIDDSPTVRQLVTICLNRAGYWVVALPDGVAAIRWLLRPEAIMPNLILLDIEMPKMDGYEMIKYFKERPRTAHIPIVMISRHNGTIDWLKARVLGACWYICKPLQADYLLYVVNGCIHR